MKSAMKVIFLGLWLGTSVFEMFAMKENINQINGNGGEGQPVVEQNINQIVEEQQVAPVVVNDGEEQPAEFYDAREVLYDVLIPQELNEYVGTEQAFLAYITSKITPAKFYTTKRGRYDYVLSHKFEGGNTLLHIAAFKNYSEALGAILNDMKFYPLEHPLNQENDEGNTPFHIAAELGNQDFIQKAVAKYLESTIAAHVILGDYEGFCKVIYHLEKNKDERTALELAVNKPYSQSKENIALDLARGIDSPVPANKNGSAVYLAAKNGYNDFLKTLQLKKLNNQQFKDDVDKALKELAAADKNKESLQAFLQDEGVKKSYEEQEKEKKEEENLSKIVHDPDLFRKFIQTRIKTQHMWTKKGERYDYVINHTFTAGNTLLHYAALYNHRGIVDLILNDLKFDSPEKHPLNHKNNDGDTPFHIAAKYGNLEFIQEAVKKYVDNAASFVPPIKATYHCEKNNAGQTALELAVEPRVFDERREAIAMKFIEEINVTGASLDCIIDGRDKNSVVYFAAKNGYQKVLQALQKNAILAAQEIFKKELKEGKEALENLQLPDAAPDFYPELSEALKTQEAFKNFILSKIDTEHWYTIKKNRYDYVQNHTFNEGNTLLHYAAQKNYQDAIDLILSDFQFSISNHPLNHKNNDGDTPFHIAAKYGNLEFIQEAVKKYVDNAALFVPPIKATYHCEKNNAEKTALELAVEPRVFDERREAIAMKFIEEISVTGASLDCIIKGRNKNSVVYFAAKNGYQKVLQALQKNAILAAQEIFKKELKEGKEAPKNLQLPDAAPDFYPELSEALKTQEAFKKFILSKIDTEHWYTIKKNRYDYVQNHTFNEGNTLLHYAAQKNYQDAIDLILSDFQFSISNHPLNRPNDKGNTPFHLAALHGSVDFIREAVTKYLFPHGEGEVLSEPNPTISLRVNYHIQKNNAEKTALELCVENGYEGDYDRHGKQQTCAILLLKGMLMSNLKSIPTFKSEENINSLAVRNGYLDVVNFLKDLKFEILGKPEAVSERVPSGWSPSDVMASLRSKYDFVKQKYNQGVSTVDSIKKIYAAWKYLQSLKRHDEEERLATQPKDE